ncbi:MAG: helix-turn-helix domain-containing protein [Rubricella sp.]
MDKRERARLFRERMSAAMAAKGMTRSDLARATGTDRSTVGQILAEGSTRLPNLQIAADCAGALDVSLDWLAALTDRPERPGDILAEAIRMDEAARTITDDQILQWHREAAGYKIRHVPASLPEMLKTRAVLEWEYADFLSKTPDQAVGAMEDRVAFLLEDAADYEIALPQHEVESFARGEGYWHGLPVEIRREQLLRLAGIAADQYPGLRIHQFDSHRVFSAPLTVFGPLVGVIYVGSVTLAFRQADRVRALARHFDGLVREASVEARDAAAVFRSLAASL